MFDLSSVFNHHVHFIA